MSPRTYHATSGNLKSQRKRTWWPLPFLLLFLVVSGWVVLRQSGGWLIRHDAVAHARHVLVLDGQGPELERTTAAARLMLDSIADTVWISGGRIFRDYNAGDFYIRDMLKQGNVDAGRIFLVPQEDHGTIEEVQTFVPIFRARGMDTVLLITGSATTRRAAMLFNRLAQGNPVFLAHDPGDSFFSAHGWMNSREGRKIWFREWLAMAWARLELFWAKPPAEKTRGPELAPWGQTPMEMPSSASVATPEAGEQEQDEELADSATESTADSSTQDTLQAIKATVKAPVKAKSSSSKAVVAKTKSSSSSKKKSSSSRARSSSSKR